MNRFGLLGYRPMLEKGSDDIGPAVCYTILYNIYLNLWTQAADRSEIIRTFFEYSPVSNTKREHRAEIERNCR